ncbi:MAG: cytochrome c oxidase subunit II [Imperialibacter sp.]|uniref:cytochrome c oxidase subunit II n=1 Tax=Imperialibacter sp. TaxID=2038411 RepID=UPI0032F09096
MFNAVVIIGLILVAIILFTLFRVSTLVDVLKGNSKKKVTKSNGVNAGLGIVFLIGGLLLFFIYSYTEFDRYNLPLASEHGAVTDQLFWVTMAITGIVFVITQILLFGFGWKYRYKEGNQALFYPDNNKLEMMWTIVPAIVLTLLIFSGWRAWVSITDKAPDEAEVVEVMGYQFAWSVRYPGKDKQLGDFDFRLIDAENAMGMDFKDKASFDDFIPREIHVPKGKPVKFNIRARDVIHSVYAPHFRLQMNAVPGMPTTFWFTPTKSTQDMREETGNPEFNFELVCNKICGKGHFAMRYLIVVDEPADYYKWYNEQQAWLAKNPSYLSSVPQHLKEVAIISSGMENNPEVQAVTGLEEEEEMVGAF